MLRRFSVLVFCSLSLCGVASGDYWLSAMVEDSTWAAVDAGSSFTVDLQLTSDADPVDINTSAIFEVGFSVPGLLYDSYTWAPPYQNGGDDWSDPAGGTIASSIYFENFLSSGEFTTGVIVSLSITVPQDFLGDLDSRDVVITTIPDTFDTGIESVNTNFGPPCTVQVVVPEPATILLLLGGAVLLKRRVAA